MFVPNKIAARDCGEFQLTNLATKNIDFRVDFANTFNLNISSEVTKAKKRGRNAVNFNDPMEGTVESEMQVFPFEVWSLLGNGTITIGGDRCVITSVKATAEGTLTLPDTPNNNTVFVFDKGGMVPGGERIEGEVSTKTFTATTSTDIVAGKSYDVSYFTHDENMSVVKINDDTQLADYRIDAQIPQKSERGREILMHITCFKATPQRNFELSYAAEGDPVTLTLTFDLSVDEDGEFVDMYQERDY